MNPTEDRIKSLAIDLAGESPTKVNGYKIEAISYDDRVQVSAMSYDTYSYLVNFYHDGQTDYAIGRLSWYPVFDLYQKDQITDIIWRSLEKAINKKNNPTIIKKIVNWFNKKA